MFTKVDSEINMRRIGYDMTADSKILDLREMFSRKIPIAFTAIKDRTANKP